MSSLASTFWTTEKQIMYPWFGTLTQRAQQNVFALESSEQYRKAHEEGGEAIGDISQSLKRMFIQSSCVGCVLPVGDLWLSRRKRLICAIEKLRLQKIFVDHDKLVSLADWVPLAHSLAGNAFHTSVLHTINHKHATHMPHAACRFIEHKQHTPRSCHAHMVCFSSVLCLLLFDPDLVFEAFLAAFLSFSLAISHCVPDAILSSVVLESDTAIDAMPGHATIHSMT